MIEIETMDFGYIKDNEIYDIDIFFAEYILYHKGFELDFVNKRHGIKIIMSHPKTDKKIILIQSDDEALIDVVFNDKIHTLRKKSKFFELLRKDILPIIYDVYPFAHAEYIPNKNIPDIWHFLGY